MYTALARSCSSCKMRLLRPSVKRQEAELGMYTALARSCGSCKMMLLRPSVKRQEAELWIYTALARSCSSCINKASESQCKTAGGGAMDLHGRGQKL